MAKELKEKKNKDGSKTIGMGDDSYYEMSEAGQNRAKALGYNGFFYTPQNQADMTRAQDMLTDKSGGAMIGAQMLMNYVALKVATEEDGKGLLKKSGKLK